MDEMIMIDVITTIGGIVSVRSNVGSKVVEFKDLLAQIVTIPANAQILTYRGMILEDDETLRSYGLQADHTIHLKVVRKPRIARTNETTPPSDTTTAALQPDHLSGSMPDMSLLCQAFSHMMQTLVSRPRMMNQIIDQNPHLHRMFDYYPQLRDMMQNPEVVCQLSSPQMMQQMMCLPKLNQQSPFTTATTSCDSTIITTRDDDDL